MRWCGPAATTDQTRTGVQTFGNPCGKTLGAKVKDSLIVAFKRDGNDLYMPLFVLLEKGVTLDKDLVDEIVKTIRRKYSPRHVPDEILEVPDIPYTISGKKVETAVIKILSGKSTKDSLNRDALRNPESLDYFLTLSGQI